MRILYVDIDSLRPDHLGCYGYHRNTSPTIDSVAREGVRFDNYYVSDAPCLPSRTAMWSGRFGIHNGVVSHGGAAAEPFPQGPGRGFRSTLAFTNWMTCLRQAGYRTATVSSFGERHSAFHFYAGFNDVMNCGGGGNELAHEVTPLARDWLRRYGRGGDWFLHVNLWDPHTPYRTPEFMGSLFKDDPLPGWLTEEVRRRHWGEAGPHSAQEVCGFEPVNEWTAGYPQQPHQMDSMEAVRAMFDGYDRGVRYADDHVAILLNALADLNVLHETAVVISADHGENLGELNVYGDHQTADQFTCRVPLVVRWPGVTTAAAAVDRSLHYHVDFAATAVELVGGTVPGNWDGRSFAGGLKSGRVEGRPYLVLSQGAWTCQRAVRFDEYICVRTYHDGYHGYPEVMLFDLKADPHEERDLAGERPEVVGRAMGMLGEWEGEMMRTATHPTDPMRTVLGEGGPYHTRGRLPAYLRRLRATGRAGQAEMLSQRHPDAGTLAGGTK
jgi:arylsulfatase A-like enzyme